MTNSLEAKVVVLGSQGVGKTSLVHRYVRNSFDPSTTSSTVGADFLTKRVLDPASDTLVRLQIWDTAGQERFRSISRLYYRGANAGLLCYDITDEASFHEMTGWLGELKQNLANDDCPLVIHVVGTKSDVVALDPSKRKVPFERTIAYVADQLYPSQASTPPPSSGMGVGVGMGSGMGSGMGLLASSSSSAILGTGTAASDGAGGAAAAGGGGGIESKRSSGFWGQDIGWDCCHEISAKDGEGIEEVFRVIARKLVEQRNKTLDGDSSQQGAVPGTLTPTGQRRPGGDGTLPSHTDGTAASSDSNADKRRSWLAFPPAIVLNDEREPGDQEQPTGSKKRRKRRCC